MSAEGVADGRAAPAIGCVELARRSSASRSHLGEPGELQVQARWFQNRELYTGDNREVPDDRGEAHEEHLKKFVLLT